MTLVELWGQIQQFGTGFVLFLGVGLFFTGRLVNGDAARAARQDSDALLKAAHQKQMDLMQTRFNEMQTTWKERCDDLAKERNYYRSIALAFAKHAEQGLAIAQEKLPQL